LKKESAFSFWSVDNSSCNVPLAHEDNQYNMEKMNQNADALIKNIDLDVFLELDALQPDDHIEPLVSKTASLLADLDDYKK